MYVASNKILSEHTYSRWHPEDPDRIIRIWEDIECAFGKDTISSVNRRASAEELCLAHSKGYVDYLFSIDGTNVNLDAETFFSEHSLEAILTASGICIELVEHIIQKKCKKAFAFIRPPGHHACFDHAMGYCIINNMAVAVKKALMLGIERIAIVDWDVHHGNGTQAIFENTGAVLFVDIHQDNLFPKNSGGAAEIGSRQGRGFSLNIPVPAGSGGKCYFDSMDNTIYPVLKAYKPQLICVSSGFDALQGDFEGNMALVPQDFGVLTRKVCLWADKFCEGKLFMAMEGGYYIENVSLAVQECLAVLKEWKE
jgi:acetoin utilization deacetylase AcuC-like enzyme